MKYFNRIISAVLIIALVFCTYPESFFYVKANGSTSSNDVSDNEISVYTVTFDSDGGSSIDSQEVEEGALATKPSDPTKDGFIFDGWYYEDTPWDFENSKVTSDITLTALYKVDPSDSSNVLEVSPIDEGAEIDPIFGAPKNMLRGPLMAPMANNSENHELKVIIEVNTGKVYTESETQTLTITDEELSEAFPEPRNSDQSEAFLDDKISFPNKDGYVFSCARYESLELQRGSNNKYQIKVYAYYIVTNSTTLMPIDIDGTDYPRPDYPSVQNAVGIPCVNGAPVKFEWSDEPLNAENATEVQMPGSAHKIYGVFEEKEEDGKTYSVFSLYTSASKVYLMEPEYGFINIQYFDFSNFDMSNVFYRDRGEVWEENDNYNYEILFGDLVEVDLSGAYGLDDFCFPSTSPQESLEILNLGNAKWPKMATVLAWQDAAGETTWYYSDDNYPSLKVLDLRNVDFSDVPTVEKDGKQIIRCDYSILADGYTRYDEDSYEAGYPCWYHDEEDGLGEDGKPLPGDSAPKMVYIDDNADGIAEGEVKWSMEMTVEDMQHRFVTANMLRETTVAKLVPGGTFNTRVKEASSSSDANTTIKSIKKVSTPFTSATVVSSDDSEYPVYWRVTSDGVLELYTEADYVELNSNSSWMFAEMESLESIDFTGFKGDTLNDAYCMFYKCESLKNINFSNFNLTNLEKMSFMFADCKTLEEIQANFSVAKNVSTIDNAFARCYALKSVNLEGIGTSACTNMQGLFANCQALESVNITGLDTSNVTNMSYMFQNCYALTSVDVSTLDTSKATSMLEMFRGCSSIEELDVSSFNMESVTNARSMFERMSSVKTIVLPEYKQTAVQNMRGMFYMCTNLESLDLSTGFKPKDAWEMFYGCTSLKELKLSNFDTSDIENNYYPSFQALTNLETFEGSFVTFNGTSSNSTSTWFTFKQLKKLKSVDMSNCFFNTDSFGSIFSECTSLESVNIDADVCDTEFTDMSSAFYNCSSLETANLVFYGQDSITNMSSMFAGCESLESLYLHVGYTSNLVNLYNMFRDCKSLVSLENTGIEDLDMSSVKNVGQMFMGCESLEEAHIQNWNFEENSNPVYFYGLFWGCKKLEVVDMDFVNLDPNVTFNNDSSLKYIFYGCVNLKEVHMCPMPSSLSSYTTADVPYDGSTGKYKTFLLDDDNNGKSDDYVTYTKFVNDNTSHVYIAGSVKPVTIRFHFLKGNGSYYVSSFVERIVPVDVYEGNHVVLSKNIDVSYSYSKKSFVGWYTPEGEKIDLDTFEATKDVTDLYAMYDVRVEFKDFEYQPSAHLNYGEKVSSVPEPTGKEHATFVRWKVVSRDIWYPSLGDTNISEPYTFDPDVPITRDMTVQASYQYEAGYSGRYNENEDKEYNDPIATTPFTVHVMVKDSDEEEYVEKSVMTVDLYTQVLEFLEESGELTLNEIEENTQMTYRDQINMAFTMYGSYTAPSDKTLIGISATSDGPAETYTFNHENRDIYFYYENSEDNGKVAILTTGYEFRKALSSEFSTFNSITRTYSIDDIDMENSVIVSAYYSKYPIYASYNSDSKTVYIYTEASTIEFNENCSLMFANMEILSLDLGKIDTSKVKDTSFMFALSYFYPDLMADFDTSNVTNMCGMFFCNKNPNLRVLNLNTHNVTNMGLMFAGTSVTSLDLSNFNTSNVTNMAGMFARTEHLTSVNVSSFDTSNVVNMNRMFYGFGGKVLNLSNFNTSKVEDLQGFAFVEGSLDLLDISGFTFESISDEQAMYLWISTARTIKLGKVEAGKTVPFYVKAYVIDDDDDGIPEHNCRYMTAADDNTTHIYKSMLSVSYYDDDILYNVQYIYNIDEIVKPEDPEKNGYTFVGWQYVTGDLFNFDNPKSLGGLDLKLYARWVPDKVNTDECKVTYVTNSNIEDVFWIKKGEKIKSIYEPLLSGELDDYTFLGWMKEDGTFWDFENDVVTEDIKLYATFDPTLVEVNYIFGEGDGWDSDDVYIPYGETMSLTSLEKDGMYEINEVRYLNKKDYNIYRDYSEFKTDHPESEVFDFSTPITRSFTIYVDCRKLKWNHTFVKEAFPSEISELAELNKSFMINTINEKNIVDSKLIVSGDEFTVPALPDGALAWTDGENIYNEGQTITGANKDVLYVPTYEKDILVDVAIVYAFNEDGSLNMSTADTYSSRYSLKYSDVLKTPGNNPGTITYKWVAIPGSKMDDFGNMMSSLGEDVTAEALEAVVQSGIGDYYDINEESLSEKYTIDELIESTSHEPTIRLYQIPAAVNYKLTIPDEISANDHSFQVSFDCGNHFCNDVTVTFDSNEVFLPSTGYTVSLYEDASFSTPLTSLTFVEKGSKTVYIKAEPEDGAARVGQDSVEIGFEISDLGYDDQIEASSNP